MTINRRTFHGKMQKNFPVKGVPLIFLLIFALNGDAQLYRDEAESPEVESPSGPGRDMGAFFALRSCHQLLRAADGEFFSPDYLCSNPPLWCNWSIQADPGKRIHLQLEDFTADDACQHKQDQIHVDDPAGWRGGHRVLQKCWQEAKFTSTSNVLHVVLLVGGWPRHQYRGFYGRYRTFGPPVVYDPHRTFTEGGGPDPGPSLEPDSLDLMYDYDPHDTMNTEPSWEASDAEVGAGHHPTSDNYSHAPSFTTTPTVPPQGSSRPERAGSHPASPPQLEDNPHLQTADASSVIRRKAKEVLTRPGDAGDPEDKNLAVLQPAGDGGNRTESSNQLLFHPKEAEEVQRSHLHPSVVEPLWDVPGPIRSRNHSEVAHLPGDHLFEVSVEVNFSRDVDKSWDEQARSLMKLIKAMISKELEAVVIPASMSSKRIKRLRAGVLYIIWLTVGQQSDSPQFYRSVHAALQRLVDMTIHLGGNHRKAVIVSVSTGDVNECGSQMALCDANADCVDEFGSYSCHCRSGFQDKSHLGSGGTTCVDMKTPGCSSSLSAETKGVYVLFFLLSSLVLMLLAAACVLAHRHRSGAFLVRCQHSGTPPDHDNNNNNHHHHHHHPADADLPPPPPPTRGPRDGWGQGKESSLAVDLPLLRFSSLLPPDGYVDPQEKL